MQGPFKGTVTESESEAGDTDIDQVKLGAENGNHEASTFPVKKVKTSHWIARHAIAYRGCAAYLLSILETWCGQVVQ